MESILVLTHTATSDDLSDGGISALTSGALEAVAAGRELAQKLDASLTIGIVGRETANAAAALASTGARILAVAGELFAQARYGSDAAACEALCRAAGATIVLASGTSRFARMMAGVAHRLAGMVDTHITSIGGTDRIEASRWFYRQRVEATITRETRPWFLLLDAGSHEAYAGEPGPAKAEEVSVDLPPMRTTVTGIRTPASDAQTIRPDAKMLFVAGAGWMKKQPDGRTHAAEAGELILKFLSTSGASLGSSKSLVDQGGDGQPVLPFLSHMNQVGQTGATPRHPKGLSTCCHGEEPHVVGWRFIGERRAISLDPNCGWTRGKADVVYIADAFSVIARVNALLEKRSS